MAFEFRPIPAVTDAGERAPEGAGGQVFAPTDTSFSTPLAVQDSAGVNTTTITVSSQGLTSRFTHATLAHVVWKAGSYIVDLYSLSGMMADMAASRAATEAAQAVAEAAAAAVAAAPIALPAGGTTGQMLVKASGADRDVAWTNPPTGGGGGTSDHNALSNLTVGDPHTQYLNVSRGDVRYYTKSQVESLIGTARAAAEGYATQRSNHSGEQPIGSITGLQEILDGLAGGGGTITADSITDATAVGKSVLKASSAANARTAIAAAAASDLAAKADGTATTNALNARLPIADDSPIKPVDEWFCTQAQFDAVVSPPATRFYTILEAV